MNWSILRRGWTRTGHIAHVKSCNSSQIEFSGEDILGNGGRISVGGENGWSIVGVLLK